MTSCYFCTMKQGLDEVVWLHKSIVVSYSLRLIRGHRNSGRSHHDFLQKNGDRDLSFERESKLSIHALSFEGQITVVTVEAHGAVRYDSV